MKRVNIVLAGLAVALVGVIVWHAAQTREPEPVYKGRTLMSWLEGCWEIARPAGSPKMRNPEAAEAVGQIGTNAIPTLLRLLRLKDSPLKVKLMELAERQRVINVHLRPAAYWNRVAGLAFGVLGTNAHGAVPALMQVVDDNISTASQTFAIFSLSEVGTPRPGDVPTLLHCATSTIINDYVRALNIRLLGRIGPPAEPAVPSLLQWLTNADVRVHSEARVALREIDPEAAAKAGITNAP